ncbi:MAG: CBS domain-containing protein [Candidatus Omnitrophota bacterium]
MKKIPLKHAEDYYIKVLLRELRLKDIMSTPVISIDVNMPFREIPEKYRKFHIRHLPVTGGPEGKLVGLLSERDLFRIHSPHRNEEGEWVYDREELNSIILRNVMVRNPFYMKEDDCMGEALVRIVENKFGCIPIVNKDMQLRGIITQEDILRVAAQIYLE